MTLAGVLEIAACIRRHSEVPLLLFTYLNPVLRYGLERLAENAAGAGIDGCLLTDLSVEDAAARLIRKDLLPPPVVVVDRYETCRAWREWWDRESSAVGGTTRGRLRNRLTTTATPSKPPER